jgi:hypothetical protein
MYIGEQIILDDVKLILSGELNDPTRGTVIAMIDSSNNLPTSQFYNQSDINVPVEVLQTTFTTVNTKNYNLSKLQKELLRWHYHLGHLGFRKIQLLMRSGVLSHTQSTRSLHTAALKIMTPPHCSACQFGKQTRCPSPGKVSSVVKDCEGALKKDNLFAGQHVSRSTTSYVEPRATFLLQWERHLTLRCLMAAASLLIL